MGRHTTPGTGAPAPDRGFWVRLGVAAVVVLLVGGWLVTRFTGGDDGVGTATGTGSPTASPSGAAGSNPSSPASASSTAPAPTATAPASPAKRPATLAFTVRYPAYITVRVPGGVTLVSRLFKKGEHRSFDKKVLQVVNGRPEAVRFIVNGKPRQPGPAGQTETFTVRRKPA